MGKKTRTQKTSVKSIAEVIVNLEVEFDDIAGKVERLDAALDNDSFCDRIGQEHVNLLIQQRNSMVEYRNILGIRLALLRHKIGQSIEYDAHAKAGK